MIHPLKALLTAGVACCVLAACSSSYPRFTEDEFRDRTIRFELDLAESYADIRETTIEVAAQKLRRFAADPSTGRPTLDILILSSGGADGAFGAGFLQGWGEVTEPGYERPTFDRVTGSSTGALMSPYALVGTDETYQRLVDLYANPGSDWIKEQVLSGVLFGKQALVNNDGLKRLVRREITPEFLEQIGERVDDESLLLAGAVNLDLGRFQIFDLTQIAAEGDEEAFEDVILASSAIPGFFPPVDIDGWTYADGATVANLFLGVDRDLIWREDAGPWWDPAKNAPKLLIRHWVIVNGTISLEDEEVKRTWSGVGTRALSQLILSTNVRALQQLELMKIIGRRRPDVEFEVRWVAVPKDADLPESDDMFDETYMRALIELGRAMGRDPASWREESPLLELVREGS
ncbi:MAG: patatin-like phospholipase family protein [Planctomycetota bacterium]